MGRVRSWVIVCLLAGCNVVFPLEAPTHDGPTAGGDGPTSDVVLTGHDEDHDGIDDAIDPCPHLAIGDHGDDDHDGIGNACDPYPDVAGDERYFYSFVEGIGDLEPQGTFAQLDDAVELGGVTTMVTSLYLPIVPAVDVDMELSYQIIAPAPASNGFFHEVGAFALAQGSDPATGDACYGGYANSGSPGFLELWENGTLDLTPPLAPAAA
ncbi:MAG: hypothetical protein H6Q90_3966, partial [Deltaproteobacteria bacterium]|nr:hypothetical protein [Deltaproteobacteria bacterium]